MSDLPYKLSQIAKSLYDMDRKAWGDAVAAAGDEIERLKAANQAATALKEQFEWWLEHSDEQDIPVPRWMARAWLEEQDNKQ